MIFYPATITSIRQETPLCRHLQIRLDDSTASATYTIPGQYTILHKDDHKDGFFAICNAPGTAHWELLIKKSSKLTEHVISLGAGDVLELSAAQGGGFALETAKGKNVIFLCVGSGITPIRAAIQHVMSHRSDYKKIYLNYGVINPNEFAYAGEFEEWKKGKIEITQLVYPHDPSWKGITGFVQDHLPKNLDALKSVAVLCGLPEMMKAATEKLLGLGFNKENILTNY